MKRTGVLLAGVLFFCPSTFSQKPETEDATMQAVLMEIRQLRRDVQTAASAARRAQILIFRYHEQTVIVERESETLQNTENLLNQMRWQKQNTESQIQSLEGMRDRAENEEERKRFDEGVKAQQEQLSQWEANEQELTTKKLEEEEDLRSARAKLEQMENELDRLDRDLEQTTAQARNQ